VAKVKIFLWMVALLNTISCFLVILSFNRNIDAVSQLQLNLLITLSQVLSIAFILIASRWYIRRAKEEDYYFEDEE
jgi:hypothetical protein